HASRSASRLLDQRGEDLPDEFTADGPSVDAGDRVGDLCPGQARCAGSGDRVGALGRGLLGLEYLFETIAGTGRVGADPFLDLRFVEEQSLPTLPGGRQPAGQARPPGRTCRLAPSGA